MSQLGIVIAPGAEPYAAMGELARTAEDAGFSAIFVSESSNDAMMCWRRYGARDQARQARDVDS